MLNMPRQSMLMRKCLGQWHKAYYKHAQEVYLLSIIRSIIYTIGPLLSFPVINAKVSVDKLSYTPGSSPAMGQNCAVECMAKVRPKLYTKSSNMLKFTEVVS